MSVLALHNTGVAINGHWLIRNATMALRAGEVTAFLGPNGSGKTTLLRLLAGLLAPSEGHVTLHGHDLRSLARRALAQRIAFVPQDTHVSVAFTVREIVEMGRHPHLRRFERLRQHDHAIVDDALRRADVCVISLRARCWSCLAASASVSSLPAVLRRKPTCSYWTNQRRIWTLRTPWMC